MIFHGTAAQRAELWKQHFRHHKIDLVDAHDGTANGKSARPVHCLLLGHCFHKSFSRSATCSLRRGLCDADRLRFAHLPPAERVSTVGDDYPVLITSYETCMSEVKMLKVSASAHLRGIHGSA